MSEQESEVLSIQLAARVLKKECSLDAGLLCAQAAGELVSFVENLNTLAGGDYFDLVLLKARMSDGTTTRAISGQAEQLALPPDLEHWNRDRQSPVPSSESLPVSEEREEVPDSPAMDEDASDEFLEKLTEGLKSLERRVKEYRLQRDEVCRLLSFLEKVQEKRTEPPRPWIGSLVLLILSAAISEGSYLALQSPVVPVIILGGGALLASFLYQREHAWYKRLVKIEKAETVHRERNIQIHKRQIEEYSNGMHQIRKEALMKFLNLEGAEKERALKIKKEFPALFKNE